MEFGSFFRAVIFKVIDVAVALAHQQVTEAVFIHPAKGGAGIAAHIDFGGEGLKLGNPRR